MDVETFHALLTPSGQEALQAAMAFSPREENFLADFTDLSRLYYPDLARAALEIAILRGEAMDKFPRAGEMYFTRQALEQASAGEVSAYRVERYRPYNCVADLGCSIGGDTLALAGCVPTIGLDRDPLRLAMAQANMTALGLTHRAAFIQADLISHLPLWCDHRIDTLVYPYSIALFFDPSRRAGYRRAFSVCDYHPPLSIIKEWLPRFPDLGVKISPGVDLAELSGYEADGFGAEIEFISLRGELKEAVLWFGSLRSGSLGSGPLHTAHRRATLLPGPHTLTAENTIRNAQYELSEPRAFLYEPDPAILRAGLVTTLGAQLAAAQLDPEIAYLTADKLASNPFARVWGVEDWFPFGLKRLRTYLRERGIGRVVVKKRGSPLEPSALIHDLRLEGDLERVIFLTQLRGRPIVIVAHLL
jgi:hypothetical protein